MLNLLMVIGIYCNCCGDLIDFMIVTGGSVEVVGQNINNELLNNYCLPF